MLSNKYLILLYKSINKSSKIYVDGHRGLVGSDLIRKTRQELDLTAQTEVNAFFKMERPEYVFLSAAKVGGIHDNNTYPAEFIFSSLKIQNNIIDACYRFDVKKLGFFGIVLYLSKICKAVFG